MANLTELPMMPAYEKTVYFSMAMQIYINHEIKEPALRAAHLLFYGKASKFAKLKAVKVLWDAFEALQGLPEPTKENTWHPNTHKLIDLRDWLFSRCELNILRMGFIRRVMNFIIILYDFDPPWRYIMDSIKDEALKKTWLPRGYQDSWVKTYVWWKDKE